MVSVVMPCFNRGSLIGESIRSVLNQEMGDLELIVVDDGSTDDTAEIVKTIAAVDDRVRFIEIGRNSGDPAVPRNIALRLSRGKYIAFLDSDDLWVPEKLQTQISFLEKNTRFGAVHSNTTAFWMDGSRTERPMHDVRPHRDGNIFERMVRADAIAMCSLLLRSSCLDTVGYFREGIPIGEDYDFKLRLAKHFEVAYQDLLLARYRVHSSNLSSDEIRNRTNDYRLIQELSVPLGIPEALRRKTLSSIKYYLARAKFLAGEENFRDDIRQSMVLDRENVRVRVLLILSFFPAFIFRTVERIALNLWKHYQRLVFRHRK